MNPESGPIHRFSFLFGNETEEDAREWKYKKFLTLTGEMQKKYHG